MCTYPSASTQSFQNSIDMHLSLSTMIHVSFIAHNVTNYSLILSPNTANPPLHDKSVLSPDVLLLLWSPCLAAASRPCRTIPRLWVLSASFCLRAFALEHWRLLARITCNSMGRSHCAQDRPNLGRCDLYHVNHTHADVSTACVLCSALQLWRDCSHSCAGEHGGLPLRSSLLCCVNRFLAFLTPQRFYTHRSRLLRSLFNEGKNAPASVHLFFLSLVL